MPGLSFLFKKRFHPRRLDIQEKIFIEEEKSKQKLTNEQELSLQRMRERELQEYEGLGKAPETDPKTTSLKFMYSVPQAKPGNETKKNAPTAKELLEVKTVELDENGDDPHVRAFRAKLLAKQQTNNEDTESNIIDNQLNTSYVAQSNEPTATDASSGQNEEQPNAYRVQSALEQALGRRRSEQLTIEQQMQRHKALQNAPVEGTYLQNLPATRHKPFNEVVRNVRCLRCGVWGHVSGDRECTLKNEKSQLDVQREQREDPMARHAAQSSSSSNINRFEDPSGGDSDPEAELLATLTRREKKLLLRKLEALEGNVVSNNDSKHKEKKEKQKKSKSKKSKHHSSKSKRNHSDSDDSGSSSSSSSSSSSAKSIDKRQIERNTSSAKQSYQKSNGEERTNERRYNESNHSYQEDRHQDKRSRNY